MYYYYIHYICYIIGSIYYISIDFNCFQKTKLQLENCIDIHALVRTLCVV